MLITVHLNNGEGLFRRNTTLTEEYYIQEQ